MPPWIKKGHDRNARVRQLNDAFRRTFSSGRVVLTSGVDALPDLTKARALLLVRVFDYFNEDDDPHGEHDFGSFDLADRKFFWKIDYCDEPYGSEDPSDSTKTTGVLTIMLSHEYWL